MTVIIPGSFDPATLGHIDLIERASRMFEAVAAAILFNPNKPGWKPVEDRLSLLGECVAHLPNVSVLSWDGLLAELARNEHAGAIVRGLRSGAEFEHEYPYAILNEQFSGVETIFLPSEPRLAVVTSSGIRELAVFGTIPEGLVPECVKKYIDNTRKV
jgi:pantetheine-phosphate adenylyltransferase